MAFEKSHYPKGAAQKSYGNGTKVPGTSGELPSDDEHRPTNKRAPQSGPRLPPEHRHHNEGPGGMLPDSRNPEAKRQKHAFKAFIMITEAVDKGDLDFGKHLNPLTSPSVLTCKKESQKQLFEKYDEELLTLVAPTGENLLNVALLRPREPFATKEHIRRRFNFVKWILQKYPEMAEHLDSQGNNPLRLAINLWGGSLEFQDLYLTFAQEVLQLPGMRETIKRQLNEVELYENDIGSLFHHAIKSIGVLCYEFIHLIEKDTIISGNYENNTALHVAVDAIHWKSSQPVEQRRKLVEGIVRLGGKGLLKMKNRIATYKAELQSSAIRGIGWSDRAASSTAKNGWLEDNAFTCMQRKYNERISKLQGNDQSVIEEKRRLEMTYEVISDYLKEAYIGLDSERDHSILELLYGGPKAIYLRLDLRALAGENNPTKVLENVATSLVHVKVETVLKEVYLPQSLLTRQLEATHSQKARASDGEPILASSGYKDFRGVFEWLRKKGVKKIIRLVVEDCDQRPHSDQAIIDSLEKIQVEVFDWRQDDLCSDTIFKAAKNVQKLFLYSTGRKLALEDWCGQSGLRRLEQLKEVQIVINPEKRPVSGDPEKIKLYEERLREALPNDARIRFSEVTKCSEREGDTTFQTIEIDPTPQDQTSDWMNTMKQFASFVHNIPAKIDGDSSICPVKIAIIDDGVDLSSIPGFPQKNIAEGMCFDPNASHHFPSKTGHGTEMVNHILAVFPKAQLYVAKLEALRGEEDKKTRITARTAAEGIYWAVQQGVHIILMSWVIDGKQTDQEDLDLLEKALDAAAERKILMVCAADDRGPEEPARRPYPKHLQSNIICVGAATKYGKRSNILQQGQQMDILLPGEELPATAGDKQETITGSSIAAALGAGLLGLLLYCVQINFLRSTGPGEDDRDYYDADPGRNALRDALKVHGTMMETLDGLTDKNAPYVSSKYFKIDRAAPGSRGIPDWIGTGGYALICTVVNDIKYAMQWKEAPLPE